eukprot:16389_1
MGACLATFKPNNRKYTDENNTTPVDDPHKIDTTRVNSLYRLSVTQSINTLGSNHSPNHSFEIVQHHHNSSFQLDEELELKEEEETIDDNEVVTANRLYFMNQNQSDEQIKPKYVQNNIENEGKADSDDSIYDGSSAELYFFEGNMMENIIDQQQKEMTPMHTANNGEIDQQLMNGIKQCLHQIGIQVEGDINININDKVLSMITNGESNGEQIWHD